MSCQVTPGGRSWRSCGNMRCSVGFIRSPICCPTSRCVPRISISGCIGTRHNNNSVPSWCDAAASFPAVRRYAPLLDDQGSVDQHMIDPFRVEVRNVLKGIGMGVEVGGAVADARQVKDHQVGPDAGTQHPAVVSPSVGPERRSSCGWPLRG